MAGLHARRFVDVIAVLVARSTILQELLGDQPGILAQRQLDLGRRVGVVAKEQLGVLAALAQALRIIGEPGARLLDDAGLDAEVR